MFQAIEALVRTTGKLVLSLSMDGDRMVVFLTPQADSKEAVLRQPLILTATAAELDEGFLAAVQSYSSAHKSLDEQVAATTAILQQAEKSQAGKAQKALSKKTTPALPAPASDDDSDEESDSAAASKPGGEALTPQAADKPAGTDLAQLLL
ncbi:PRTRC system protein E [Paraburkholderia sediminicola]|uniref:PRTRC system protein E n=1 Tax=Paraburkholderia sediminicola TaxID=458836 RepID=UPI0038BCF186